MKIKKIIATLATMAVFTAMSSTACINASAAEFCSRIRSIKWSSTRKRDFPIKTADGVKVGNLRAVYKITLFGKKVESVCSVAGGSWEHFSTVMSGGKASASKDIRSKANANSGTVTLKNKESLHTGAIWVE